MLRVWIRPAGNGPSWGRGGGLVLVFLAALVLLGGWPALGRAASCYQQLISSPSARAGQLSNCIRHQEKLYQRHAATAEGARYLYRLGRLNGLLHRKTGRAADLKAALEACRGLIKNYPRSPLADDAQYLIGQLMLENKGDKVAAYVEFLRVEVDYPQGDTVPQARARLRELGRGLGKEAGAKVIPSGKRTPPAAAPADHPAGDAPPPETAFPAEPPSPASPEEQTPVLVTGLRHWSTASYTRIVVDLDGAVQFKGRLLRPDPEMDKPARLYFDLSPARLGAQGEQEISITDGHLRRARMGQYNASTVRVVLDIQAIDGYKAFALQSPDRLVIDVIGPDRPGQKQAKGTQRARLPRGKAEPETELGLATQLGLGVETVVIDPGHGGRDPGALTCQPGLVEKQITLKVARHLARLLEQQGVEVVLTRNKDVFVSLEERTAIANTVGADLFISIHVNAARDRRLSGVETYFLNLATDERAIALAARENATTTKSISDLQAILNDLMLNTKIHESNRLAFQAQRGLISHLRQSYPKLRSLGVKQAPFYVLLGAQMPAVLVEIGFGTNQQDCRRLATKKYLERVAEGIAQGVAQYIRQNKAEL
ncbi:MAG: N-acetylmuramoyl-L-alanine amidase [Deltaproteobacteria bacterium]|nr:N-acetylmuramoyl-L-alanine amidase [Deltaproteobacteria bacterium]